MQKVAALNAVQMLRCFKYACVRLTSCTARLGLPYYPLELALERKRVINDAVVTTKPGQSPAIPMGFLPEERMMWKALFTRVEAGAREHACAEFNHALASGAGYSPDKIPDLRDLSDRLREAAGWEVRAVSRSVCPKDFFAFLEHRQMPVTQYFRPHTKFDFTDDPDCIHELVGHVPVLFIPSWAKMSESFGRTGSRLVREGKDEVLEQLTVMYFAIVEKGLVRAPSGVKAIGASVITGTGELVHAMRHPEKHLPLETELVLKHGSTDEENYMEYFFVGDSVDSMAETAEKFMESL